MSGAKGRSGGHNRKSNREKELLGAAARRLKKTGAPAVINPDLVFRLDGLGEAGKAFFESQLAALTATGIMGHNEGVGLHIMARRIEDWYKADCDVRKASRWTAKRDAAGNIVAIDVSGLHRIERELMQDLISLQREYGQTPLSRDSIRRIAKGESTNPFKRLTA